MNTKRITKIITVLLIVATILSFANVAFGASIPTAAAISGTGASSINSVTSKVIWIVQLICYAAAVVMLMVLGVKFITSSPEGKAEIKKSAVIYVIGAIMVFAAGIILGVIQNVANNIT